MGEVKAHVVLNGGTVHECMFCDDNPPSWLDGFNHEAYPGVDRWNLSGSMCPRCGASAVNQGASKMSDGHSEAEAMLDLDTIEARAAAATLGPWKFYTPSEHKRDFRIAALGVLPSCDAEVRVPIWNGGYVCRLTRSHPTGADGGLPPRKEDAAFIAHARADVPALVAEVRRLRQQVELMRQGVYTEEEALADALAATEDGIDEAGGEE